MTDNIYEKTLIHWAKLIKPFFPKDTKFETIDTFNAFGIYIKSPLESSDKESRKLYRKIILAFNNDAINEYIHNYEPGSQRKADSRLKGIVATRLRERKPENDSPQQDPLPEYWLITTDLLNR